MRSSRRRRACAWSGPLRRRSLGCAGKWRVQLLLLAPARAPLRAALAAITALTLPGGVRRIVDVDPQSTV